MRWLSQQQGVVRYNCADSLDRTNAASYFGAVQALAEQCSRLGLQVDTTLARATLPGATPLYRRVYSVHVNTHGHHPL